MPYHPVRLLGADFFWCEQYQGFSMCSAEPAPWYKVTERQETNSQDSSCLAQRQLCFSAKRCCMIGPASLPNACSASDKRHYQLSFLIMTPSCWHSCEDPGKYLTGCLHGQGHLTMPMLHWQQCGHRFYRPLPIEDQIAVVSCWAVELLRVSNLLPCFLVPDRAGRSSIISLKERRVLVTPVTLDFCTITRLSHVTV